MDHLVNNGAISHGFLFEETPDTSALKNVMVSFRVSGFEMVKPDIA